ncbi:MULTISPECIES: hypothetical protein [unclassified Chitinophaga]|uniref:hypothetical protein n=1 Tax=unclassified Chitinophaga TaxID=2619133 RepID=UPI00300FA0AB
MKKIFTLLLLMAVMMTANQLKAQDLVKGKLDFLKDVTELGVSFDYNKLTVGTEGKEANYLKRKKAERDAKEPGTGDKWIESWFADRKQHYEPKFSELFTKYGDIKLTEDSASKYLMVVRTKFIEVGYNVAVSSQKAAVNLEIEIFDRDNLKKSICKIMMNDMKGGKGQFDMGLRIADAYAKAGKELGQLVSKKVK